MAEGLCVTHWGLGVVTGTVGAVCWALGVIHGGHAACGTAGQSLRPLGFIVVGTSPDAQGVPRGTLGRFLLTRTLAQLLSAGFSFCLCLWPLPQVCLGPAMVAQAPWFGPVSGPGHLTTWVGAAGPPGQRLRSGAQHKRSMSFPGRGK